ncbi:MAG: hypothetical protein ACOYMN_08250 [Roseimicrobium sp.]|jgi:hypothetical protein
MAKKTASKPAKAKDQPSKPPKPRTSKAPGEEGVKPVVDAKDDRMDSMGGKKSAMQSSALETLEQRLERLRGELPDGYEIIDTSQAICFGDMDESDEEGASNASTTPQSNSKPPKKALRPFCGRRTVFEANKRWVDRDKPLIQTTQTPLSLPLWPDTPKPLDEELKQIRKDVRDFRRQLWKLYDQALRSENSKIKDAAGRAVANLVDLMLHAWPEKETYQTCVDARIRQIKKTNAGFIQRWNKELHRGGVPKKRTDKDKPLERFVQDGESRLHFLAQEVIHAMLGGEHPLAAREATVLAKWMNRIPGLMSRAKEARKGEPDWTASEEISEMVDDAKLADVEGYFQQVFKPVLENGLWRKLDYLGERKFGDEQGVLLTMLRTELATMGD